MTDDVLKETPRRDSHPLLFNLAKDADAERVRALKAKGEVMQVIDRYESQLKELFAIDNPPLALSAEFEASFAKHLASLVQKGPLSERGIWAYFPWILTLVHILPDKEFQKVRTARNKNLITEKEQKKFYDSTVGIAGLSVGNSVALAITLQGGARHMKLADHDMLELSNLNRIRSGIDSLGVPKVELTARQIYLLNPYAQVELFPEGLTDSNMNNFFDGLDIIIDEIDNLIIKYRIREEAKKRKIPVLMAADNADSGVIDIERYDVDSETSFFNGRIQVSRSALESLDKKETGALIANFIGLENHSERMLGSLSALIGSNLVSWPQLGSTALLNGSALTYAVRRITNGNHLTSGRVSFSLDDLFGQESDVQMNRKRETPNTARAPVRHLNISREVEEILDAARFAPSADNTQPWRVVIENESTFLLYHVPERDMTPYDSGQRTSFMSHGAFIENLCIAAARQGKHAAYALETPSSINKWLVARITLQNAKDNLNTNSKVLYEAIFKRRTNRKPYRKEKLSDIVKQHLLTAAQDLGWGEIKILDYPQPKVAAAAALSGQIMFQNLAVHKGLFEHIRWSTEEAERTKDGFLIDTFELPYPAKLVFKLAQSTDRLAFLNRTVKLAENIPTGMQDLYEQSGAFIGLISDKKEFSDYLMLGRLMQRIWLQGTIDNIYLQPIGAICFFKDMLDAATTTSLSADDIHMVERAYTVFEEEFSLNGKHLLFLFRAGVADEPSAKTYRLPLSEIITIPNK